MAVVSNRAEKILKDIGEAIDWILEKGREDVLNPDLSPESKVAIADSALDMLRMYRDMEQTLLAGMFDGSEDFWQAVQRAINILKSPVSGSPDI